MLMAAISFVFLYNSQKINKIYLCNLFKILIFLCINIKKRKLKWENKGNLINKKQGIIVD